MYWSFIFTVFFLSVQGCPNPTCNEALMEDDSTIEPEIRSELLSTDNLRSDLERSNDDETVKLDTDEPSHSTDVATANVEDLNLEKAMEEESAPMEPLDSVNKGKRQICSQILEQLKALPCDNPLVLSCQGGGDEFPCGISPSASPLRATLADVDNIITGAESLQQPAIAFPSQISPIQTLPVSPAIAAANSLTRIQPGLSTLLRPPRILNEAERRERQKGIFEGLLRLLFSTVHIFDDVSTPLREAAHSTLGADAPQFIEDLSLRFGTVVNHVDSFLMDKSKMLIKGLSRMVESEEDKRFE